MSEASERRGHSSGRRRADRPLVVVAGVEMKDEGGLAACGEMPVPEIERRERVSTTLDRRGRGRARTAAQDYSYRHGRVLCVRRAARQSGASRQARRGRRLARARCRGGRELRGPQIRRQVRHAVGDRQAKVPGADLRETAVRSLSGGVASNPRDFRRVHAARRAAFAR